ncbi:endonuclease III, putative (macronuclear) [Tetrahymena thermophila SB210]|uniref:Endonuclease III, putative n=1 Tax=Tetrahymena thermophila (strain SB210) TaxID=312017 RepID=I7MK17_TETTS|nr:endonuclease III, putative [Tetrahymena thermophila SB210]EAR97409.1 endonuclease III, putative [Tetrahymena thermophila SB210]|eukprot:XP_001017654.1 endonuclease III, putative [Tetrahymena thermophila SB210]
MKQVKPQYKFLKYYSNIRYFLNERKIQFYAAGTHLLADTSKKQHIQDFQTLVAIILNQQTTNYNVEKSMRNLKFNINFTPQQVSIMNQKTFGKYLDGITYPGKKSVQIIEMAETLVNEFDGQVPTDPKELSKIKGVGKKTIELYQKRLENRNSKHIKLTPKTLLFLIRTQVIEDQDIGIYKDETQLNNQDIQDYLQSFIDPILWKTLHIPIDLFVDEICQEEKPKCSECPLSDKCPSFQMSLQDNKNIILED